ELYEVRPQLGEPNVPGGGSLKSSSSTPFALHAKVFVFDRRQVFIGSMNFDERSRHINTELGVLIDSPELAKELAERFEAVAQPANSYVLSLGPPNAAGKDQLRWRTEENASPAVYEDEPSVDPLRRFVRFLRFRRGFRLVVRGSGGRRLRHGPSECRSPQRGGDQCTQRRHPHPPRLPTFGPGTTQAACASSKPPAAPLSDRQSAAE